MSTFTTDSFSVQAAIRDSTKKINIRAIVMVSLFGKSIYCATLAQKRLANNHKVALSLFGRRSDPVTPLPGQNGGTHCMRRTMNVLKHIRRFDVPRDINA